MHFAVKFFFTSTVLATAALASSNEAFFFPETSSSSSATFTIPLVPHRVHERRLRRRLSATTGVVATPERPTQYRRDRLLKGDQALQVGALYQGYGTHYVDLWVGTPPQRQTLIVDTGSGVTAFPCSACTDCGQGHHIDDFFVESNSTTFTKVPCNKCKRGNCSSKANPSAGCKIGMSYQEGSSWNAFEAIDSVYIGGPHDHGLESDNGGDSDLDPNHAKAFAFDMMFGCQTRLTGLFKTQLADGIMGCDNAKSSFWQQMWKADVMKTREFSMCFSRQPTADREGTEAGAMTMGGYDKRLHKTPLVFTTHRDYRGGFFSVRMRKIYLRAGGGGDSATSTNPDLEVIKLDVSEGTLNRGNIIVDSGTTDTYFTRAIAVAFKTAWGQLTDRAFNNKPMSLTTEELDSLPTILFQITGDAGYNQYLFKDAKGVTGLAKDLDPDHPYDVILALPPSHYMEWDDKKQAYIARFYTDEGSGSVLGANTMMGHNVFFDIENSRIGWAESDCKYTSTVEQEGFDISGLPSLTKKEEVVDDEPLDKISETGEKSSAQTDDEKDTETEGAEVPDVKTDDKDDGSGIEVPTESGEIVQETEKDAADNDEGKENAADDGVAQGTEDTAGDDEGKEETAEDGISTEAEQEDVSEIGGTAQEGTAEPLNEEPAGETKTQGAAEGSATESTPTPKKEKSRENPSDSHDNDVPADDISAFHPGLDACGDVLDCRAFFIGAMSVICLLGICCGRYVCCSSLSSSSSKSEVKATEMEVTSILGAEDDDDDLNFAKYRDDPGQLDPPGANRFRDDPIHIEIQ